ncbi:MAG: phosphate ABC transporter permease family protein, partial [Pseudomonadota bacterium]|nr:phosphate ABC transporter permease family protein [Pseudomonadota bacterium]
MIALAAASPNTTQGAANRMSPVFLFLLAIGLGLAGWLAGRAKARAFSRDKDAPRIVSRPGYHAWYVAIWVAVPLALFAVFWSILSPILVDQWVLATPAG